MYKDKLIDLNYNREEILNIAKEAVKKEGEAVAKLVNYIDENFLKALELIINCSGKLIITGVGKSGHIGGKIAATLSSTGTPAFYLNPAEGVHGDIGVVMEEDLIIAISKSGETEELLAILPYPKRIGVPIIAVTENKESSLSKIADITLLIPSECEVCPMNLAPTTSTTLTLVLGDAIAVALMKAKNFTPEKFAIFHPAGSLGKKLKKVKDLMTDISDLAVVDENEIVIKALDQMVNFSSLGSRGVCLFKDKNNNITGILADGDLKRLLLKYPDLVNKRCYEIMIREPKRIKHDSFAFEALQKMENKYSFLLVEDENNNIIGVIHFHDILKGKVI
ncbi:MAG: KpsF/GutQ family sugar-phosphate isomerase [Spirochaetes bacterium]|nr:KpsF/GutQ family sugar-phosphate isomerase [Spirochaetota bacterium]